MKPIVTATLAFVLLVAAAPGAHADAATAEGQARAWMTSLLDPAAAPPAASKDAPLEYLTVAKTRSCKPLRAGRANDDKGTARVKACLIDARKRVAGAGAAVDGDFQVVPFDGAAVTFPAKQRKKMATIATDATVVTAGYQRDGLSMVVYLVIAADGRVRALWMIERALK